MGVIVGFNGYGAVGPGSLPFSWDVLYDAVTSNVSVTAGAVEGFDSPNWKPFETFPYGHPHVITRIPLRIENQGNRDSVLQKPTLPPGVDIVDSSGNSVSWPFTLKAVGQQGMAANLYVMIPAPGIDVNEQKGSASIAFSRY
jgi:hypothetical protein